MTAATAVTIAASTAAVAIAATAAAATVSVASAACVDILTMKSLCELLLGCLAYCQDFTCETESLSCHLMVEVHLHAVFIHLKHHTRNHRTHAVEHRDCVARYEKIFANLAVDLERCLREIDDAVWVNFTVSVLRRKSHVE
jgi:hypothetical protein